MGDSWIPFLWKILFNGLFHGIRVEGHTPLIRPECDDVRVMIHIRYNFACVISDRGKRSVICKELYVVPEVRFPVGSLMHTRKRVDLVWSLVQRLQIPSSIVMFC